MEIFAASYLLPMSAPPIQGGAIAVADGRIVDIGSLAHLRSSYPVPVTDYAGSVIMPGLINAHTHLELTHFPAWKIRKDLDYAPRTYVDWVIQLIKLKRGLTLQELELSLREGCRISLKAGTTTLGDILSDFRLLPLYSGSAFSGRLFFEAIGQEPVRCAELLEQIKEALNNFRCGNLLPGLSPHAPHTISSDFLGRIQDLSRQVSIPLAIHLAESKDEDDFLHDSSGNIAESLYPFVHWENYLPPPRHATPASYLDGLGSLNRYTMAIHCVHINAADAETLKTRGVAVVLCPRSNDRLNVGEAPAYLMKKAGIRLALGTDSLASNDSLSLWDEMRFLRCRYPGVFSPEEVLKMSTVGGAAALHVADAVGSLERGKRGDFLVVKPSTSPTEDELYEALVEESQVEEVFIGGRRLE